MRSKNGTATDTYAFRTAINIQADIGVVNDMATVCMYLGAVPVIWANGDAI